MTYLYDPYRVQSETPDLDTIQGLRKEAKQRGLRVSPKATKKDIKRMLYNDYHGTRESVPMTKKQTHINKDDLRGLKEALKVARTVEGKAKGTIHEARSKRAVNALTKLLTDIRNEDILL